MKIKRFFSSDMRTAIRLVREELGADAVILSNDRVNGGVEVVAAVDYDESLLDGNPKQEENAISPQAPVKNDPILSERQSPKPAQPSPKRELAPIKAQRKNAFEEFNQPVVPESDDLELDSLLPPDTSLENRIDRAFRPKTKSHGSPYLNNQAPEKAAQPNEFYQLDDAPIDEHKISETLYDVDNVSDFPNDLVSNKKASGKDSYSVWSQEPTLMAMRNEITTLRGMLEQQLTGLAWGDLERKNPLRAKLIRQLLELGFSPEFIDPIVDKANEQVEYRDAWQYVLSQIGQKIPVQDDDIVMSGGVVALVGATGVGKTTTIAKLAARYALRHGRNNIALITTDTFRIGALEQLRTYGRILGIPVKIAHNKKQLIDLIKLLSEKKFVLIDTAGMGQRDIRLMEQFTVISDCAPNLRTLLALSSTTHRVALDETVRTFSNVEINGCILTKLDETTNLGGILSVVAEHNVPVTYISDGQRVPEDLHLARSHTLINRSIMIARRAHQPLDDDSLELEFSRMSKHVGA